VTGRASGSVGGVPPRRHTAALSLLALLLLTTATGLAVAQRSLDPSNLLAAIAPDGALLVIDPRDAAVVLRSVGAGGAGQFPAWSTDGNRVAIVVAGGGGRVDVVDVAAGGERTVVYREGARSPIYLSWAPGDRHLAVLANTPSGTLALDLVDLPRAVAGEEGAVRPFATGAPFYWSWSRSGRALLVHQNVLGPERTVGVTPLDAFAVRRPLPDPGAFQSPAFSSSERYLAYAALRRDGERRVVVVPNPERAEDERVTREVPHLGGAAFSWRPGFEQLAVQSALSAGSPHPYGPVDLLDVATGAVTRLSDDLVVASWWSPDGRFLALLSPVTGGGGGERQAGDANLQRVAEVPAQRAGGLWVLRVVEPETGRTETLGLFVPSPRFVSQYLPFFDQYARSHRLWSPASDALVLPALDEQGVSTLVVFALDGSVTPLVAGDMPAWNVR
jgi:TolB protein